MLDFEDIHEIYDKYKEDYKAKVEEFTIGNKNLNFNSEPAILGVINLSADSWMNHSICYTSEQAIRRGQVLTAQGADIIDIGTESTIKNAARADEFKQKSKLIPLLETFCQEGILTSVETYHPDVARECLKAGANVINFTGTENQEEMYRMVADFDAAIIICYLQGKDARNVQEFDFNLAKDPIDLVYDYFGKEIERATQIGVKKIFLDPGLGLAYTNFDDKYKNGLTLIPYQITSLLNAFRLRKLGFPIVNQIPTAFEIFGEELRSGQVCTAVFAALGKSDLLRTHEVAKVKGVLDIFSLF